MDNSIFLACQSAKLVLDACTRPTGFYASGLKGGYDAVWARDSLISGLGAATVGRKFQDPFRQSLVTMAKNQSKLGQIPNCVGSYNQDRQSNVTFNTIDSSLWYLIGHYVYSLAYEDDLLLKEHKGSLARTLLWLRYQDPNEDKTLSQQPTMDWMDAFPHKYGRVINTHALYYAVLKMYGDQTAANYLRKTINGEINQYLSLYDPKRGYYLPWSGKNHDDIREQEEWFDTLGNLLAVITGLATPIIAHEILKFIDKESVNRPYPCKAIWPPIEPGDKEWHDYFNKCDARSPYRYLNGGIWPFIGGFYIAALIKVKEFKRANAELELLAKANLQTLAIRDIEKPEPFNEWLDGRTGRPEGEPCQAWSAGAFLYANACVEAKKVIFFDN